MRVLFCMVAGAPLFDEGAEKYLADCNNSNSELVKSLRRDENEEALHKIALDDWKMNRMTEPKRVRDIDTSQVCLDAESAPLCSSCDYFLSCCSCHASASPRA